MNDHGAFVFCFPHVTGTLPVFRVEHRLQTARIVLHSVAVLSTGIHYLWRLRLCYFASCDVVLVKRRQVPPCRMEPNGPACTVDRFPNVLDSDPK